MGRPVARWRDDLDSYAAEEFGLGENEWMLLAPNRAASEACKEDFADVKAEFEAFVSHFAAMDPWMRDNPPKIEWNLWDLFFPPFFKGLRCSRNANLLYQFVYIWIVLEHFRKWKLK